MDHKKCIVITGSSRGIGFAMAKAFVAAGHHVIISGRRLAVVDQAVVQLQSLYPTTEVYGTYCDVAQIADLQNLWDIAIQHFGKVDIWINNAGSCTATLDFKDIQSEEIKTTIETNIQGAILGSQVALQGMLKQGSGQIFNMEGWGSRGEWSAGMTVYCATKRVISYFSRALYKETKHTNIKIGTLGPGMVATDLLVSSWKNGNIRHWQKKKRLFLFIIDPAEIVADYLVRKMLVNNKTNTRILWMTPFRLILRFFQPYYWRRNPIEGTELDALDKNVDS